MILDAVLATRTGFHVEAIVVALVAKTRQGQRRRLVFHLKQVHTRVVVKLAVTLDAALATRTGSHVEVTVVALVAKTRELRLASHRLGQENLRPILSSSYCQLERE